MKKYYALDTRDGEVDIYIYGDITSQPWEESDVTSFSLSSQLAALDEDTKINVYINSYGGEVAEGLAIYNALKRRGEHVSTYCDGFACSAASVVFMAGYNRIMYPTSLLFIHNAWTLSSGDSDQLRKDADDLDVITAASESAYLADVNISVDALKSMMDDETWISPEQALEMGFATQIMVEPHSTRVSQSARKIAYNKLIESVRGEEKDVKTGPKENKLMQPFKRLLF